MRYLLNYGGSLGLLAIVTGLSLLVRGLYVVIRIRDRERVWSFLSFALLPFVLGLLGTFVFTIQVQDADISIPELQRGFVRLRLSAYLGLAGSAPAVVLGLVGLYLIGFALYAGDSAG